MGHGSNGPLVYITVDSIDQILPVIEQAGGTTLVAKTEIPGGAGSWATFRDPAGNKVAVYQGTNAG